MADIAILGATSRMAQDFIPLFRDKAQLHLFARGGTARRYDEFPEGDFDAIINFVGVGDPARIKDAGPEILAVTREYDALALAYLKRKPGTRYIFLSSGAAYGGNFNEPARDGGEIILAATSPEHIYGAAKQEAEVRHRALADHRIFDLRVFNYVSRAMDVSARFLLAEMVNAARNGKVLRTADRPMTRDFLHPADFVQLVECCLAADGNMALDCYSQSPITKRELLDLMRSRFGMVYEFIASLATTNITGEKPHYYSQSRRAAGLGYAPAYSSQSAIVAEVTAILSR